MIRRRSQEFEPVLISTGGDQNAEAAMQDLDKPALDTCESLIPPRESRLDNGTSDSQGTRGMRDGSLSL
jgi:hypothetical protein